MCIGLVVVVLLLNVHGMVMSGWSVNLTTLFLGRLSKGVNLVPILSPVTDNYIRGKVTVEKMS